MPEKDKVLLMNKVEGTLKPRMFANLLEEAVDEIQDHLNEFDVQHIGETAEKDHDDLLDTYIDAKRIAGLSELTLVSYHYEISRLMKHLNLMTHQITPYHIRDYFAYMKTRGVSDVTVENIRQKFSAYFGWLEKSKLIRVNPMMEIEKIRIPKTVKPMFSNPDITILKQNCFSVRDNAIINLLLSSGCRIGEVVRLNRTDINFEAGEGKVLGKGNKERPIFVDDVTLLFLKEYLATRTDDNEALFINRYGNRLHAGGYREILRKLAEKADVKKVHPHRFRRTFITRMLNRGMPIQEVALLVGHESLNTTMKYYSASKARIKSSYQRYID
jgi:site-specific recombinase XerD